MSGRTSIPMCSTIKTLPNGSHRSGFVLYCSEVQFKALGTWNLELRAYSSAVLYSALSLLRCAQRSSARS